MQRRCDSADIVTNPSSSERNPILEAVGSHGVSTQLSQLGSILLLSSQHPGDAQNQSSCAGHPQAGRFASSISTTSSCHIVKELRGFTDVHVTGERFSSRPTETVESAAIAHGITATHGSSKTAVRTARPREVPLSLPSLVREPARQYGWVNSLIDTATLITTTLWPAPETLAERSPEHSTQVISAFITETSRKSQTSMSTMQLALLYCVRFKRDQDRLARAITALELKSGKRPQDIRPVVGSACCRRNFLTALILASKFLQDRNYSSMAWSKISAVTVAEINLREREFLEITGWRLDIKNDLYASWSNTLERFINEMKDNTIFGGLEACQQKWQQVIHCLVSAPDPQMLKFMSRMVGHNTQLMTPVATPTLELSEFAPSNYLADAAPPSVSTLLSPSAHALPSPPVSVNDADEARSCSLFDEFICSPRQLSSPCVSKAEEGVFDADKGCATPRSLSTDSPALTEGDESHDGTIDLQRRSHSPPQAVVGVAGGGMKRKAEDARDCGDCVTQKKKKKKQQQQQQRDVYVN